MRNASAGTTRTRTAGRTRSNDPLLRNGQVLVSTNSRLRDRISRLIGEGGFGQVYLARREGDSATVPETVCVKVSERMDGWLREAYFGQLLGEHPRAIRIFDAFPLIRAEGHVLYCLALEYARHGDLRAYLHQTGKGWPEASARREIAGILEVLGK